MANASSISASLPSLPTITIKLDSTLSDNTEQSSSKTDDASSTNSTKPIKATRESSSASSKEPVSRAPSAV